MKTREVREVSVSLVREMTTVERDVYTSLLMCVKEAYIWHMYVCYRGFYMYAKEAYRSRRRSTQNIWI